MTDTYRHVIASSDTHITEPQVWDGTGISDTIKASLKHGIVIRNQTFTGSPSENDIDIVRGSSAIIGPNDHTQSRPGVSNLTIKGGFDGVHFVGDFGAAELGQYSIYDQWFALEPTCHITFAPDARGTCILWRCEVPAVVPPGVRIIRKHPAIVWAYFLYRSITQFITGK